MKKNIFLSGLSAKLALVAMALTSVLFTSCEKEDFNATFEADAAKAVITVSAFDAKNGTELNPTRIETSAGTVAGKEITITGNKDIAKQTVEVTIECNGLIGKGKVEVPALKAGSVGRYSITFLVGEKEIIVPDEKEAAEAKIIATAVNGVTGEALEGVKFEFASTVAGGEFDGVNAYTIIGNKEIAAQTVTVTATCEGMEPAVSKVEIPALKENTKSTYYVNFRMIENTIVEEVTYLVSKGESTGSDFTKYLTGNYNHTHNGIDQWLSNDSEYLLNATVTYTAYTGLNVIEKNVTEDAPEFVTSLIDAYESVGGIKEVEAAMTFKVSAWSLYAAWVMVNTTVAPYKVEKLVNGEVKATVATFSLETKSVKADHTEIAHPSHSHAYVPGHGHDHGHGNGNAGGGISYAD